MKTNFESGIRESTELERISQIARQTVENIEKLEKATGEDASRRLSAFTEKLKKSRLLKTLIFATASHAAILNSDKIVDFFKAAASRFENWDGHVMTPQSEADRQNVGRLVADRESRINQSDLAGYKQKTREKLSRGEDVSFEDIEFDLEEKNGVPHEQVESARKKAHEKMDKWRPEFVDGVNVEKLDEFVKEMYGPRENYSWGQGIVSTYFNTGIRNCHTVAKGQLIVLDNLMHSMSPEAREKIVLGTQYVEAHEYATLTILGPDKKPQKTYLLEPGIREVAQDLGEAGTATVSLGQLKRAIVAEQPVIVDAKKGDVEKGPKVDFTVNQAVDDNIVINGPLKPSDFVLREMGEKSPEHIEKKADLGEQIIDPSVIQVTFEEPKAEMTVAQAISLRESVQKTGGDLYAEKDQLLTPEAVKELNRFDEKKEIPRKVDYGNISGQDKKSIDEMFGTTAHVVSVQTDASGLLPSQLFESLRSKEAREKKFDGVLEIVVQEHDDPGLTDKKTRDLSYGDYKALFLPESPVAAKEIRIVGSDLLHDRMALELALESRFDRVVIDGSASASHVSISSKDEVKANLLECAKSNKTIILDDYFGYLERYPEILLNADNIESIQEDGKWMNTIGPEKALSALKSIADDWDHLASSKKYVPLLQKRIAKMEKIIKQLSEQDALEQVQRSKR